MCIILYSSELLIYLYSLVITRWKLVQIYPGQGHSTKAKRSMMFKEDAITSHCLKQSLLWYANTINTKVMLVTTWQKCALLAENKIKLKVELNGDILENVEHKKYLM